MPKVDRTNPKRSQSSASTYSLMEFMRDFKDDEACMEWLWRNRFSEDGKHADCPKCGRYAEFKHYKTKQRRYSRTCTACGHHVSPTAGTIFHGSATALHLWFYAIYLMTSTRCGISAKQLEREVGVTYKTAWRMFNKIRNELMADDPEQLSGDVEIDETAMGGKPRRPMTREESYAFRHNKTTVLAAVERGGRVKAAVIPSRRGAPLRSKVREWVDPASIVLTDEWPAYNFVKREFLDHSLINHSVTYVDGSTHTNTVEGFFGLMKPSMKGVYRKVSRKWLQGYLNEYAWRYSHRNDGRAMFETLIARAAGC